MENHLCVFLKTFAMTCPGKENNGQKQSQETLEQPGSPTQLHLKMLINLKEIDGARAQHLLRH